MELATADDRVVEHRLHRGHQRLGPVQHAQDGAGGVESTVPQADEQIHDDGGVLGVALHHAERVLGAVDMAISRSTTIFAAFTS